ncbi:MAG TPA: hypothetical protein DEF47_23310 [Herpetosiphon sp.]|nr:hypothetical protein [Herpetosiphon sp.]
MEALRQELSVLRVELRQFIKPRTTTKHQPTFERNLAPEREPEALADVAQQLSEQVSSEEIGAYLKRRRVTASDIQLTEQDLQRNQPRNRRAHHGYPSKPYNLEAFYGSTQTFIVLFCLIALLMVLLTML